MPQIFRQRIAIALAISTCAVTFQTNKAKSQPVLLAPALCSTGIGCVLVGVAVVGGVAYYVWQSQGDGARYYDKIEEPEEHDQWGIFYAKSEWHCRRLAAGRKHWYDSVKKQCHIKG